MKILRIVQKILKYLLYSVVIFYIYFNILGIFFDYFFLIYVFFDLFGVNADIVFSTTERGPEAINAIYNSTYFYYSTYGLSIIATALGLLILSRRRTGVEASGLLLGFIIPPERKSWGRVIDSTTTRSVPFAAIYLEPLNGQKKIIKTVADSDGRYKLLIPDKKYNYSLLVRASGYKDLKIELKITTSPIYGNEYIKDIFIHQIGKKKRNPFSRLNYTSSKLYWYLILFIYFMSIFSLFSSLYYVYAYPGSLYGALTLALYVFSVGWNTVMIKDRLQPRIGRVLDLKTRRPISEARVYIYKKDKQLEVLKTDAAGVIHSNLNPGEYEVRIAKEGYITASDNTFMKINLKIDGYFDEHMFLQVSEKLTEIPSKPSNPFA